MDSYFFCKKIKTIYNKDNIKFNRNEVKVLFRSKIIYPKKDLTELREDVRKRIDEIDKDFIKKSYKIDKTYSNLDDALELFSGLGIGSFIATCFIFLIYFAAKILFNIILLYIFLTILFFTIAGILKLIETNYYEKNWHYIDELNKILKEKGLTDLTNGFNKLLYSSIDGTVDKNIRDSETFEFLDKIKKMQDIFPEKEFLFSLEVNEDSIFDFFDYLEENIDEFKNDEDWYRYTIEITPYMDGIKLEKFKISCNRREFKELIKDKDSIDFSYLNPIIEKIEKDS